MDPFLFLKAMGIGLAVAAPVGPMALLCMRSTLDRGAPAGLALGLGIATSDALYGAVAAFGLAGLSSALTAWDRPLQIAAGLFLIGFALLTLRSGPAADTPRPVPRRGLARLYLLAVALTLANPPTIATFAAIFAALTPPEGFRLAEALTTTAGVGLGSALWWSGLVTLTAALRHAITPRSRRLIALASGLLLATLGTLALARALLAP